MELGHIKSIAIQKNNLKKMGRLTIIPSANAKVICVMGLLDSQLDLASFSMPSFTMQCIIFFINFDRFSNKNGEFSRQLWA